MGNPAALLTVVAAVIPTVYDEEPHLKVARETGNLAPLAAARHARALEVGKNTDPSLALLRSAVRMKPDVADYWNDLGVLELHGGAHTKAVSRFRRALRGADPWSAGYSRSRPWRGPAGASSPRQVPREFP